MVVASPAFLKRHGTPIHPKDVSHANCITRNGDNAGSWPFFQGKKRFSVAVTSNLECNMNAPAIDACVNGLGYGRFMSYQIAQQLKDKSLRVVLADYEAAPKPVNIVYPSRELLPAKTRSLIDWLKRELPRKLP
jgi:DNA-binding transcriptional LysR family regulator